MDWHPYTRDNINSLVPKSPGVYAFKRTYSAGGERDEVWIYVGQSANIRERLLTHFNGVSNASSCIGRYYPDYFGYSIMVDRIWRLEEEKSLIELYRPLCNKI